MSKRIRDLIELAYETGWASCRIEAPDALAPTDRTKLRAIHPTMVEKRNAARDALEADATALRDAAMGSLAWLTTFIGGSDGRGHVELTVDVSGLRESAKWLNDAIVKMRE